MKVGVSYDEGRFLLASPGGDVIDRAEFGDAASHRALLEKFDALRREGRTFTSWVEPWLRKTVEAGENAFVIETHRYVVRSKCREGEDIASHIEITYIKNAVCTFDGIHLHEIGNAWVGGGEPWDANWRSYERRQKLPLSEIVTPRSSPWRWMKEEYE